MTPRDSKVLGLALAAGICAALAMCAVCSGTAAFAVSWLSDVFGGGGQCV